MPLFYVRLDDDLSVTTTDIESAKAEYDAGNEVYRVA